MENLRHEQSYIFWLHRDLFVKFKTSCVISFLLFLPAADLQINIIIEMTPESQCEIDILPLEVPRLLSTTWQYCIKEEQSYKNQD